METKKILSEIEGLVRSYYETLGKEPSSTAERITLSMPAYDWREATRAIRTILGGWISQGPNVVDFEKDFAQYSGCQTGIAVNSGSSANLLALLALKEVYNLKEGDEVIIPAATFATVAMPIIQIGLVPVYVDVRRNTLNMDPEQIPRAISKKTKILMPVHTLGYPAPMTELAEAALQNHLVIFEDCCEAHGSTINGRKVGSFGEIATCSFFVAHNMTTGEGGMIVTSNPKLEAVCRSLREFGRCDQKEIAKGRFYSDGVLTDYDKRYLFERLGYNFRMTDIAAAFGIEQLRKLDAMNEQRRSNAALLKKLLSEFEGEFFELPKEEPGYAHTYYTFPVVLTERFPFSRREFVEYLESHGVETRPLFAGCLPDQPGLRKSTGRVVGPLTQARFLRDRLVFVGIHPGLKESHIRHLADVVTSFVHAKNR
jgi:CDP-6-deoxy-D-xylo-4-hexulose-3-dehydrase